ncbi:hypothetical protein [Ascidiaceihabitans sp.]|uniref:hypothetical protein n=1 Tax=Ascidiaceihabitans sp. TaxID=1872644 RepID=UPI003298463B
MYEISGFTKRTTTPGFNEETALFEFDKVLKLMTDLNRYHSGFNDLSHLSDQVKVRGEELAEYLLTTDEPDPGILEEWDRLEADTNRISLHENPRTVFNSIWKQNKDLNAEFGTKLLNITVKSNAERGVELTRSIDFDGNSPPLVKLSLPMSDSSDYWYQSASTTRELMFAMMEIWDFKWIVARPSMYQGMNKHLFSDRVTFGWMGWTSDQFSYSGDALSLVEPTRDGSFMLLQERMMTLKKPDVEACNQAESALLDQGVLSLISEI